MDHWYEIAMTFIVGGFAAKYVAMRSIAKHIFDLANEIIQGKKNGVLDKDELAGIGQTTVDLIGDLWAVTKGLFPNRSKINAK
jgi:hypothetical protein